MLNAYCIIAIMYTLSRYKTITIWVVNWEYFEEKKEKKIIELKFREENITNC